MFRILVLLLGSLLVCPEVRADTYAITGTVTDSVTMAPVSGAEVTLLVGAAMFSCFNPVSSTAVTGTDGRYAVSTDRNGFCLRVSAPGYEPVKIEISPYGQGIFSAEQDVVLTPHAEVEVAVVAHGTGEPIEGAVVKGVSTDTDGLAVFTLPAGEHPVCADARDQGYAVGCIGLPSAFDIYSGAMLQVSPAQRVTLLLELRAGTDLHVRLRSQISNELAPVSLVRFTFYAADQAYLDHLNGSADATGTFVLPGVPQGQYYIIAETPGDVMMSTLHPDLACTPDCAFQSADLLPIAAGPQLVEFHVRPEASASGRVVDAVSGLPLAGMKVSATDGAGPKMEAKTRSDGRFSLPWLPAGELRFGVAGDSGYPATGWPDTICANSQSCFSGDPVALDLGESVDGIDFRLQRGAAIGGTVWSALTGTPLDNANLIVMQGTSIRWQGHTDSEGVYLSRALVPGTYTVAASKGSECRSFPDAPCVGNSPGEGSATVEVVSIDVLDIDMILQALPQRVFVSGFESLQ